MKHVFYFGDKYYEKSGTRMGVLYTEHGQRYDWGFLQRDVAKGEEVIIKKATAKMIEWADSQLQKYK